jgi:hypothetical protein
VHAVPRELVRDGRADSLCSTGDERDALSYLVRGHRALPSLGERTGPTQLAASVQKSFLMSFGEAGKKEAFSSA